MLFPQKSVPTAVLVSVLVGCAMSPAQFQQDRYTVGNARLCKTLKGAESSTDWQFMGDVQDEVKRRGLDAYQCEQIVGNQALAIGAGVLVAAAVVAAARSGGGGGAVAVGGGAAYAGANYDYDWEWDQYYGDGYALVWSCRGVQTGQFAEPHRCNGKMQTDWKWPAK